MKIRSLAFAAILAAGLGSSAAQAADFTETDEAVASEWEFKISAYLWMAGLNGTIGVIPALPPVNVDASFGDIADTLRFAFAGTGELKYDRFKALLDISYLSLKVNGSPPGPLFAAVTISSKTLLVNALAGYEFVSAPRGNADIMIGGRIWNVDTTIAASPVIGPTLTGGSSEFWIDPILAIRGEYEFADRWRLKGYADIGGFGISSDFTWMLYGGIEWDATENVSLELGYRHLDVDYQDGAFVWDVSMSGPMISGYYKF